FNPASVKTVRAGAAAAKRAYGLRRAAAGPPAGPPPGADRLLTYTLRLDPLARTGGPDEHLPSTARIHRWAQRRDRVALRGARAAGRPRAAQRLAHTGRRKRSRGEGLRLCVHESACGLGLDRWPQPADRLLVERR